MLYESYQKTVKKEKQIQQYLKKLSETWEEIPPVFVTSSQDKTGKEELLDYIDSINKSLKKE